MRPVSLQAAFFFSLKQVLELMNIALSIFCDRFAVFNSLIHRESHVN